MRHSSLFSGIGGFDLAAEWMGWENVFHCDNNEFCQKILDYYWPNATSYKDIKTTDFSLWRGNVDILSGGFPCQPYSQAGKRKGKEDDRHLWSEMLRAIREIQPRWVVGENVHGIVNWSRGMVFEEIRTDLETEGYQEWPYVLPACSVGADHKRYRSIFVAHINSNGQYFCNDEHEINTSKGWEYAQRNISSSFGNTNGERLERAIGAQESKRFEQRFEISNWRNWPTESPFCNGDDGLSFKLDGIAFPKWRRESIQGGGNAVVPQLILKIFKTIEQYEQIQKNKP